MRPFGFENDRVTIRESEAEHIRAAAALLIEGASLRHLVNDFYDKGIHTPGGNAFQINVLRRVLGSPRIAGKVRVHDDQLAPADWPAILDEDTYAQVVEILSRKAERAPGGEHAQRTYLLTGGLSRCGLCGKPLLARPNNDGKRGYVCSSGAPNFGCGKIRINADPLETYVVERVLANLLRPDARKLLGSAIGSARDEAAAAPGVIEAAEKRLPEIESDYVDGKIKATELHAIRDELHKRIRDAKAAMKIGSMLRGNTALEAENLVSWWEAASLEEQRALLDTLVSSVVVSPVIRRGSKIFDPDRIRINWRTADAV